MSAFSTMLKVETKLFLRDPATVIFGVLFPTVLLVGMGAIPALRVASPETNGLRPIDVWAPTALVFGMVLIATQHIPISIATYRERGVLRRMSTTPVHPRSILVAHMIVAFGSVIVSAALMITTAHVVLGVPLPEDPLRLTLAFVVGYAAVLSIAMIGAAVVRTSNAATQLGTLLFVGLMFFGGAFLPRMIMPDALQRIGDFVPPGLQALTEAWSSEAGALTSGGLPFWAQIITMLAITVICSTVAARLFRWE